MSGHGTWLVDGHDIESLCIISDISNALGVAEVRAEAIPIPYRSGRIAFPRTLDRRRLSWALTILDIDPATGGEPADPIAQFLANWQTVRGWFFPVDTTDPTRIVVPPLTISQSLTLPSGVQTVTGTAEVDPASLFPTMPNPSSARAVVNLNVVDGALLYT